MNELGVLQDGQAAPSCNHRELDENNSLLSEISFEGMSYA